jgi:hypothetical protein
MVSAKNRRVSIENELMKRLVAALNLSKDSAAGRKLLSKVRELKDATQLRQFLRFLTFFRLIDSIMPLPEEMEASFRNDLHQFEDENQMEFMSSIERHGFKKGREEGLLEGIELALDAKFGHVGRKLLPKIRSLGGLDELREFAQFLTTAKTLPEVRKHLK